MAIKYHTDEKGWTQYEISWFSRSPKDRRIVATKSESGGLGPMEPEALQKKLQAIEEKLRIEAQREMVRREGLGSLWASIIEKWTEALQEGKGSLTPIRTGTWETYLQSLQDFTGDWMAKPASGITPADVLDVLAGMKKQGYSDARIYNVKVAINQCYKWAILKRLVPGVALSPGLGISVIRKDSKRPEALNYSQIVKLIEEAYRRVNRWRQIWRFVLLSGARAGEAYELRVKDVDREEKRLYFERKYNFESKQVEDLKDAEWRNVPINEDLDELFVELGVHVRGPEEYVLPRFNAWTNGEQARHLRAFCIEIGVPSICFHTLRALWATQLLQAGVPSRVVMIMGGWADPETMERYIRRAGIEIQGATDSLRFKKERPARILRLVHSA